MIFDKLESEEFAVRVLRTHIETERVAATYIFSGSPESPREELALAFAAAINCGEGRRFESCPCVVCRRIESGQHPDIRFIGDAEARSLKIEEIREMLTWVSLKPYEAKYKFFILKDAERLTVEAANALLKTLEEPPPHTIFCLLVENRANLLETIQSRSFELRLAGRAEEPDYARLRESLPGIEDQTWADFLENYQSAAREEAGRVLGEMLFYFREQIQCEIQRPGSAPHRWPSYLKALDTVYETREAVDANANIKLALTRLAVQLESILPSER